MQRLQNKVTVVPYTLSDLTDLLLPEGVVLYPTFSHTFLCTTWSDLEIVETHQYLLRKEKEVSFELAYTQI